jgi:DNA-binding IscR family transcriptional regulator
MILQTLRAAGKPLPISAIAELTGVDQRLVRNVIALMKRDGEIVSSVRSKWEPVEK